MHKPPYISAYPVRYCIAEREGGRMWGGNGVIVVCLGCVLCGGGKRFAWSGV